MALATFKILSTLWPFFKEWAFGGKNVYESFKNNKSYTVFTISWFVLVGLVVFLSHRLYNLGHEIVKNNNDRAEVACSANTPASSPTVRRRYSESNDKLLSEEISKLVNKIECLENGSLCKNENK